MYNLHKCLDEQLFAMDMPRPTLIMPEADDPRTVEAAERLTKFANVVLLTGENELKRLVARDRLEERIRGTVDRLLKKVKCVELQAEHMLREEFAEKYVELGEGKKWAADLQEARKLVSNPVLFSVMATRLGYADMLVGGLIHSSREFILPCLRLLERGKTVYEMALFALPDEHPADIYEKNLVMFADVALNPVPTPEALATIAVGSCMTMRGIIPVGDIADINCALISYSTRGSGEGPSVERIRKAAELIPGMLQTLRKQNPLYESIHIEPELQISVAVSQTQARTKLGDQVASMPGVGRANVLIAPNLDVGNLLYHIYTARYPSAQHLLLIGGLHNRALDFSRSSTADDVVLGAKGMILRNLRSRNYRPTPKDYFFPRYRVLAINPGSTSTKLALFEGEKRVFQEVVRHDPDQLQALGGINDQQTMRLEVVRRILHEHSVDPGSLQAVVARGGLVRPMQSGTYLVNDDLLADLRSGSYGEHASNLGAGMAREITRGHEVPAYVVDPPVVDELDEPSRVTGLPGIRRRAAWHALNHKACAKRFADERGKEYEQLNLIVAHLGGGISVGAHRRGRCVFVRDALYDGPLTPQRTGTLPQRELIEQCYSGTDKQQLTERLTGQGGLLAHLGTSDLEQIDKMIEEGDKQAELVFEAMVQQIAMEVSSMIPKFLGEPVDQIILTGGMVNSSRLRGRLLQLLAQLQAPVTVRPGEDELEALRDGALRVLAGHESPRQYGCQ